MLYLAGMLKMQIDPTLATLWQPFSNVTWITAGGFPKGWVSVQFVSSTSVYDRL